MASFSWDVSRPSTVMVRKQRARRLLVVTIMAIATGVIAIGVLRSPDNYWLIVISAVLGVLLAISELVARYRDDPAAAILSIPAVVYVTANAAAGAGALYLIRVFGWSFGTTGAAREVSQVLVAGLGSAALFRASFFNIPAGEQIIAVGPSAILNIILAAADRAVDRQRAVIRAARAAELMNEISFNDSAEELLAYCTAAMQNASPGEAKAIENRISELRGKGLSDRVKSCILGLELLTLVGDQVLRQITGQLKAAQEESTSASGLTTAELKARALKALEKAGGVMSLQELRQILAIGLEESVFLIRNLQEGSVITVEGEPGSESVCLITVSEEPTPGMIPRQGGPSPG